MDRVPSETTRRLVGTLHLVTVALLIPAVLYHHIFRRPPGAPGAEWLLAAMLVAGWAALSLRNYPSPTGRPWSWKIRAALLLGGNLAMLALFWAIHRA